MTRLIDADAYLKKVCTYNETGCGSCRFQTKCPADEPTIDAEPVRHRFEKSDAGMTVSEYRERMIQAFHNADCDSLIAVVVLPTEKEFQHLEWLLKKEYVPFLEKAKRHGKWIAHGDCGVTECSCCGWNIEECVGWNYCPNCGADMRGEEEWTK